MSRKLSRLPSLPERGRRLVAALDQAEEHPLPASACAVRPAQARIELPAAPPPESGAKESIAHEPRRTIEVGESDKDGPDDAPIVCDGCDDDQPPVEPPPSSAFDEDVLALWAEREELPLLQWTHGPNPHSDEDDFVVAMDLYEEECASTRNNVRFEDVDLQVALGCLLDPAAVRAVAEHKADDTLECLATRDEEVVLRLRRVASRLAGHAEEERRLSELVAKLEERVRALEAPPPMIVVAPTAVPVETVLPEPAAPQALAAPPDPAPTDDPFAELARRIAAISSRAIRRQLEGDLRVLRGLPRDPDDETSTYTTTLRQLESDLSEAEAPI